MDVAAKDPKAHGALHNAALMKLIKGDDEGALELLKKAYAIEDKMGYGALITEVSDRIAMRKTIRLDGSVSTTASLAH